MINLLLPQQQSLVRREYALRRAALGFALVAALAALGLTLLVPSIVILRQRIDLIRAQLATMESSIPSERLSAAQRSAARISEQLQFLSSNEDQISPADLFAAVRNDLPSGVTLAQLSFASVSTSSQMLTVGGVAGDRDSLTAFANRLEADRRFAAVNLPVDDLVPQEHLPFTLSLTVSSK